MGGPNDGAPSDPITTLAASAVQMHELKVAFMAAGFTESQAMQLLIAAMHEA